MKYLLLLLPLMLTGCDFLFGKQVPTAPERHKNIPKTAVWSGGLDGGTWFDCSRTKSNFEYNCTVYDEYNGDKIISGIFKLAYFDRDGRRIPLDNFLQHADFTQESEFFSGSFIETKGRLLLFPVKPTFPEDRKEYPEIYLDK